VEARPRLPANPLKQPGLAGLEALEQARPTGLIPVDALLQRF